MAFRVGQKVVCVDANPGGTYDWCHGEELAVGEVYTIRRAFENEHGPAVWLDEVARTAGTQKRWGNEVGYGTWRFRPVVDISDLTSIVTEVFNDRPRTIAPDKFDKQRIHSAATLPPDAAIPVAAGATGIPLSVAPPISLGASSAPNSAAEAS